MSERIRGPYSTDGMGVYIFARNNFMFAQVRGWGGLTGGGGMKLNDREAAEVQKANAQFMVDAMNEKEAREPK